MRTVGLPPPVAVTFICKSWEVVQNTSYIRMGSLPNMVLQHNVGLHNISNVCNGPYCLYYIRIVVFRVFPDLESGLKIAKIFRKNPEKSEKNRIYIYAWDTIQGPTCCLQGSLWISKYGK